MKGLGDIFYLLYIFTSQLLVFPALFGEGLTSKHNMPGTVSKYRNLSPARFVMKTLCFKQHQGFKMMTLWLSERKDQAS